MKVFSVDGYWKDDRTEFTDYIICEYDDTPEGYYEEEIFFYGLSEQDLKDSCEEDGLEFIITNYKIIQERGN